MYSKQLDKITLQHGILNWPSHHLWWTYGMEFWIDLCPSLTNQPHGQQNKWGNINTGIQDTKAVSCHILWWNHLHWHRLLISTLLYARSFLKSLTGILLRLPSRCSPVFFCCNLSLNNLTCCGYSCNKQSSLNSPLENICLTPCHLHSTNYIA